MKQANFFSFGGLFLLLTIPCITADFGAVGDYVQDIYLGENYSNLYNSSLGLHFDGMANYGKDAFSSYTWSGSSMTKTRADLLIDAEYANVERLLFYDPLPLGNPVHHMSEHIQINSSMLRYYEPGFPSNCSTTLKLAVPAYSLSYIIDTNYMPLKYVTDSSSPGCDGYYGCYADVEYRGKIPFFGEEYYVKDVARDAWGDPVIYLDKGSALNISNTGYNAQYMGYAFKLNHIDTPAGSGPLSLVIDVLKPNGTVTQVSASYDANRRVDDLEIAAITGDTNNSLQAGSIIVYDHSSEAVLQYDDISIGGQVITGWEVSYFKTSDDCPDGVDYYGVPYDCNISAYKQMDESSDSLLRSITIQNNHDLFGNEALGVNQSLFFPANYMLRFKGYLNSDLRPASCTSLEAVHASYFIGTQEGEITTTSTTTTPTTTTTVQTTTTSSTTTTTQATCTLTGDDPPCGVVTLTEVIDYITLWANDQADLADVIELINAWAASG
jgi:hypothetical protein